MDRFVEGLMLVQKMTPAYLSCIPRQVLRKCGSRAGGRAAGSHVLALA